MLELAEKFSMRWREWRRLVEIALNLRLLLAGSRKTSRVSTARSPEQSDIESLYASKVAAAISGKQWRRRLPDHGLARASDEVQRIDQRHRQDA